MELLVRRAFKGFTPDPKDYERPDFRIADASRTHGVELASFVDPD
jgi:hypothetical protein